MLIVINLKFVYDIQIPPSPSIIIMLDWFPDDPAIETLHKHKQEHVTAVSLLPTAVI
jgi:hypothetical protein